MDNPSPGMGGTPNNSSKSLEAFLELYLVKKAPFQLPMGLKKFIVAVSPWLTIIGIIIALPLILLALGLGTFAMGLGMFSRGYMTGGGFYLQVALTGLIIVLELMALPGLFKRTLKGWQFVFYAVILQIVANLLSGGILGALISGLISLYFLFQIKELYR